MSIAIATVTVPMTKDGVVIRAQPETGVGWRAMVWGLAADAVPAKPAPAAALKPPAKPKSDPAPAPAAGTDKPVA